MSTMKDEVRINSDFGSTTTGRSTTSTCSLVHLSISCSLVFAQLRSPDRFTSISGRYLKQASRTVTPRQDGPLESGSDKGESPPIHPLTPGPAQTVHSAVAHFAREEISHGEEIKERYRRFTPEEQGGDGAAESRGVDSGRYLRGTAGAARGGFGVCVAGCLQSSPGSPSVMNGSVQRWSGTRNHDNPVPSSAEDSSTSNSSRPDSIFSTCLGSLRLGRLSIALTSAEQNQKPVSPTRCARSSTPHHGRS